MILKSTSKFFHRTSPLFVISKKMLGLKEKQMMKDIIVVLEWLMKVVEMPMDDLVMEDIGYLSL